MTLWQLTSLAGAVLVVLMLGLRAVGAARWAVRIRAHTRLLEAARPGVQGRLPSPARFDGRELDGLPAPVQRCFRAALVEGQPMIDTATLQMAGTINLSAQAARWKPFTSRQWVATRRPGFLWDARVSLLPGVPVQVEDSCIAGQGRLIAKVWGLFTVADLQGDAMAGEAARVPAEGRQPCFIGRVAAVRCQFLP